MLARHELAKVDAQKVSGDKTWLDESSSEEEEDKVNLSDFDASSDEDREPDDVEQREIRIHKMKRRLQKKALKSIKFFRHL